MSTGQINTGLMEFQHEVCRYLGINPNQINDGAWDYHYKWNNPRWTAVLLLRDLLGPQKENLNRVRYFARSLGFAE